MKGKWASAPFPSDLPHHDFRPETSVLLLMDPPPPPRRMIADDQSLRSWIRVLA